ncbi:exported hypothetical protein [Cupriavidus taiwanensis]|nr:exported hypothetical protein [Cupriavidus taiwanensis]SOY88133.1 exported hypothetical protein [Cupriavidus taiwanensis]
MPTRSCRFWTMSSKRCCRARWHCFLSNTAALIRRAGMSAACMQQVPASSAATGSYSVSKKSACQADVAGIKIRPLVRKASRNGQGTARKN